MHYGEGEAVPPLDFVLHWAIVDGNDCIADFETVGASDGGTFCHRGHCDTLSVEEKRRGDAGYGEEDEVREGGEYDVVPDAGREHAELARFAEGEQLVGREVDMRCRQREEYHHAEAQDADVCLHGSDGVTGLVNNAAGEEGDEVVAELAKRYVYPAHFNLKVIKINKMHKRFW